MARCRAIAAHEARPEIKGPDNLAEIFLSEEARQSLLDPAIHALILKKLAAVSPGGYEYFIARTAYLDAVVERALRENIPQIVFLGAGYDTRSYRFRALIQETRIFELDSPPTQRHKCALLEQAHVAIPPQLTFVPIDFNQHRLAEKLSQAGFTRHQQTVFIWEGVSYYLPGAAIDDTLRFIRLDAAAESIVCFDYMIAASELADRFGAQASRTAMQAMYAAEPLQFELKPAEVAPFLAERGFRIVEHLTAGDLQARYLTLHDGSLGGQVLDLFGLVQASVMR